MDGKMIKDEWFSAFYIKDDIWRISDSCQDNIYLIIGSDKALLIDTGWGVGDLFGFVRKITTLQLIVAVTHGHSDHALGNDSFDYVYSGEQDIKEYNSIQINEKRTFIKNSKLLADLKTMPDFNNWGSHARRQDIIIQDRMEIDLGGRVIIAYLTPGHTKGSACFLDKKAEVLFTGDSFVPSDMWGPMWFHLKESTTLLEFYEKMSGVIASGGFKHLLSGHGECGLISSLNILTLVDGIRDIIEGNVCGVLEKTLVGDGLRCNWEGVSLIYDPNKIS